ncbi:LytTR family DNA-binding domain-containing protein [Acetobacterium sp.]|uniref:LytTR family DNA-binding domain-containing protein n=1 Tax=Acetobacterium sp. TaxID=1872094 RepID=UPI000CC83084|nr:LytTR family DNA-binding domain-containing protein [Acetobacterium sp.]MDO9492356.1 LytTR family DNA-binding domain-containing protein [Acetobacterium sp.]PKM71085.1 MAG: LytTR family transcriptional regulator [Firmicutes bacterium HGW-Firmicutes-17]
MKIKLTQQKEQNEIEVEIKYCEMNNMVNHLVKRLENYCYHICGNDNGRIYKIDVDDIFYIESVDRKTFIYSTKQVFRTEKKLYQILEELKSHDFVQINKSVIVNINVLESMEMLANSRIQVTLQNGEKLNATRTYIPNIKKAFNKEENN